MGVARFVPETKAGRLAARRDPTGQDPPLRRGRRVRARPAGHARGPPRGARRRDHRRVRPHRGGRRGPDDRGRHHAERADEHRRRQRGVRAGAAKDGWDTVAGLCSTSPAGCPRSAKSFDTDRYRLSVIRMTGGASRRSSWNQDWRERDALGFAAISDGPTSESRPPQPGRGDQGLDHLAVAEHHAQPDPRHPDRGRRPGDLRGHPGHPPAQDQPGRTAQRHRPRRRRRRRRGARDDRGHRVDRTGRPHGAHDAARVLEARARPAPVRRGDKMDRTGRESVAKQLMAATEPCARSARSGDSATSRAGWSTFRSRQDRRGIAELLAYVRAAMPESPFLFPADEVSDVPRGGLGRRARARAAGAQDQSRSCRTRFTVASPSSSGPHHRRDSSSSARARRAW